MASSETWWSTAWEREWIFWSISVVLQAQHLMWHVEGERERERLEDYGGNCESWGLQEISFAFLWIRVCHLMRSSHSSLCVQTCPSNSIYRLQTRNPSEFCVNKSRAATKKSGTLKCAKNSNSKQLGYVPELLSAAISPLFLREKGASVKTFGSWWRQEFLSVCCSPAVGRGQWSYPSQPDADAAADALLHWILWCTAPLMRWMPPLWCTQLMQRTLSADPSFNWPAQAHLKAAKQPKNGPFWLFPETLMATFQPNWLFMV